MLTPAERGALEAAIDALMPLQTRVLQQRLQAVFVVDAPGMAGTALTRTMNPGEPEQLFDVIIRGSVFGETVSEWLTAKERTCFDASRSTLQVEVEAGRLDAIRYAMLHEATHMVDKALGLTPAWDPKGPPAVPSRSPFTRGIWKSPFEIAPPYASPVLQAVTFNPGTSLSIARAPEVYGALGRTPFVSLYASRSWSEDVAELVAVSHWVRTLGQPFRFVVRDGPREVTSYEPMASPLVQRRLGEVERFYQEQ